MVTEHKFDRILSQEDEEFLYPMITMKYMDLELSEKRYEIKTESIPTEWIKFKVHFQYLKFVNKIDDFVILKAQVVDSENRIMTKTFALIIE